MLLLVYSSRATLPYLLYPIYLLLGFFLVLLSGLGVLRIFKVAVLKGVLVEVGVLVTDRVLSLNAIWRVARVFGSGLDSSPSDSLLVVLPLELGSVSISSSFSALEVSESVLLTSTPLASPCCYFFSLVSAILWFVCS